MAAAQIAHADSSQTVERVRIDFLFLDLTTCTRCLGADHSLEFALEVVGDVLGASGVEIEVPTPVLSPPRPRSSCGGTHPPPGISPLPTCAKWSPSLASDLSLPRRRIHWSWLRPSSPRRSPSLLEEGGRGDGSRPTPALRRPQKRSHATSPPRGSADEVGTGERRRLAREIGLVLTSQHAVDLVHLSRLVDARANRSAHWKTTNWVRRQVFGPGVPSAFAVAGKIAGRLASVHPAR